MQLPSPGAGEHGISQLPPKMSRFGDKHKFVPVIFLSCTMSFLYVVYVVQHCIPMLQLSKAPMLRDHALWQRGAIQVVIFHILTGMLSYCYVWAILQHPGEVPDDDPLWRQPTDGWSASQVPALHELSLQEVKKSGDRRHCKWCAKYKPDRTHHCRVCRVCILKMDHHCPWIYNCVGFKNYKYFYLVLSYGVLDLHFMMWTMGESVVRAWDVHTPFIRLFSLLFGECLSIFLGFLVTSFFVFHSWLMVKSLTTIEFCEKQMPKKGDKKNDDEHQTKAYKSAYDLGWCGNVKAALGADPWTWLVPTEPDIGDGLSFVCAETRLTMNILQGSTMRRKVHQKTQRTLSNDDHGATGHADTPLGQSRAESDASRSRTPMASQPQTPGPAEAYSSK